MKTSKKIKSYLLAAFIGLSFSAIPLVSQANDVSGISDEHQRLIKNAKVGFKKVDGVNGFLFDEKNDHQVIYLFSYSCPYCYAFSSYMQQWAGNLRDGVSYHKMPVSFSNGWDATSIAYIISTVLKIDGNSFDSNVYKYIHEDNGVIKNKSDLVKFFKAKYPEIESSEIERLYSSKEVLSTKKRFDRLIDDVDLEATPSILVINKEGDIRMTSPAIAEGELNAIFTVEYLIYLDKVADNLKKSESKELKK